MRTDVKTLVASVMSDIPNPSKSPTCELDPATVERWHRIEELLERNGFPKRHLKLKEYDGALWLARRQLLRSLMLGDGATCLLIGPGGTGKTQLAICTARYVMREGNAGARYVRSARLFQFVRASRHSKSLESESEVMERYLSPRLLVIDELGERSETQAEDRLIHNVVCDRHDSGKDTLLLTNQTREAALNSVGSSIQSRMAESGGVIECVWPSFRSTPRA